MIEIEIEHRPTSITFYIIAKKNVEIIFGDLLQKRSCHIFAST